MLERIQFYLKHSFNDLRVNGQRTFFALLCIGAGVAAIVSLQTLAVMIQSTLTGNLQQQNLGDISAYYTGVTFDNDAFNQFAEEDNGPGNGRYQQEEFDGRDPQVVAAAVEQAKAQGYLGDEDSGFGGVSATTTKLTLAGVDAIRADLEAALPDRVDVTYKILLANFGQVFIGTGPGVNVTAVGSDAYASNFTPLMVDPNVYPFYDTVITEDGQTLAEAFAAHSTENPGIVISRDGADNLASKNGSLQVGDMVTLDGSSATYTILGIVPTDTEIRSLEDITLGLYGNYYYITADMVPSFGDLQVFVERLYVYLDNPSADIAQANTVLGADFPYLDQTTTEDLRDLNEQIAEDLETLVTIMGLLGLLLGSIGIINTMQVVVRRRTTEIAVLKTLGLQGAQVTQLFLTEAFLMGVFGSMLGVLLGWGAVFFIRGSVEGLLAQGLTFEIAPSAVRNGVIVGTLVTTVFGFMPTLSAAQVRPGTVLRPDDNAVIPRAGIIPTLISLIFTIIVISLIAQTILGGQFALALIAVSGAFFGAGVIFVFLWVLIWLVGRLMPSFNLVDMKLSKRQLLATKRRGAVTLLALVVAVFALSTITLFADTFANFLDSLLNGENAQPVLVQSTIPTANDSIDRILQANTDVTGYTQNRVFSDDVQFVSLVQQDGTRYDDETALRALVPVDPPTGFVNDIAFDYVTAIDADQATAKIIDGASLADALSDLPALVIVENGYTTSGLIRVGDQLTLSINGQPVTFEIVGIQESSATFTVTPTQLYARWQDLQSSNLTPDSVTFSVAIPKTAMNDLRRGLSSIPGVFVFDTRNLEQLINVLLDQFRAFPTMLGILGLVVGGVVIANSVALATLERRKEIAIMKSVGLQRERVLGMLLLENGLLGLVGGLLGVGTGLITLVVVTAQIDLPLDVIPFGMAFLLMSLCIIVALLAALTTAWGASGEKPLNVLRHE